MSEQTLQASHNVTDCMQTYAEIHELASGGMFVRLDPGTTEYQDPDCFHIESTRLPAGQLEAFMQAKYPLTEQLIADLESHPKVLDTIDQVITDGKNAMVATTHFDMSDLGKALGVLAVVMERRGTRFQTAMIVGKVTAHLGVKIDDVVVPIVDIMRGACDHIFFNQPTTPSLLDVGLTPEQIRHHNSQMARPLLTTLRRGSTLWAVAPTASTRLREVNPETVNLFTRKNVVVLPASIRADAEQAMFVPELSTPVTSQTDVEVFLQRCYARVDERFGRPASSVVTAS